MAIKNASWIKQEQAFALGLSRTCNNLAMLVAELLAKFITEFVQVQMTKCQQCGLRQKHRAVSNLKAKL
jgi:hypothetical protein